MFYYHHQPNQNQYNNISNQIYPVYQYINNSANNGNASALVNANGNNQNEYLNYWYAGLQTSHGSTTNNNNTNLSHSPSYRQSPKGTNALYRTNYDFSANSANTPYVYNIMSENQPFLYQTPNRINNIQNEFNSPKTFYTYYELNNFNSASNKQIDENSQKQLLLNTYYNDYINKLRKSQSNQVSSVVSDNRTSRDRLNNNSDESDDFGNNHIDIYHLLTQKNLDQEQLRRIERNQNCLTLLIEGDLIEYVEKESDIEEKDGKRYWAIYMGNTMIMRFEAKSNTIVYDSYWKIAKTYYIFINRDLDRRFFTLPIYEILNKARDAYANRKFACKLFSSDRNFVLWCRFDVNKSDIEKATQAQHVNEQLADNCDMSKSKSYVLCKFLNSLDQGEDISMGIEL